MLSLATLHRASTEPSHTSGRYQTQPRRRLSLIFQDNYQAIHHCSRLGTTGDCGFWWNGEIFSWLALAVEFVPHLHLG